MEGFVAVVLVAIALIGIDHLISRYLPPTRSFYAWFENWKFVEIFDEYGHPVSNQWLRARILDFLGSTSWKKSAAVKYYPQSDRFELT